MDINYLLEREQVESVLAGSARSGGARSAHLGLARGYRARIDAYRTSGAAAALAG